MVERCEMRKPIKVTSCFLRRLAHDGHLQAAADDFSDFPEGHAFVSDSVIVGSRGGLFQSKNAHVKFPSSIKLFVLTSRRWSSVWRVCPQAGSMRRLGDSRADAAPMRFLESAAYWANAEATKLVPPASA